MTAQYLKRESTLKSRTHGYVRPEVKESEEWALGRVAKGETFGMPHRPTAAELESAPERALWLAVIKRAIYDATGRSMYEPDGAVRTHLMDKAQAWFRGAGKDYRAICAAAGVDADRLRSMVIWTFPDTSPPPRKKRKQTFWHRAYGSINGIRVA